MNEIERVTVTPTPRCATRARGADPIAEIDLPDVPNGLSRHERSLYRILLNPEHFATSPIERAKAAGCSRRTYFLIMKRPHFASLIPAAYRTAIGPELGRIIGAAVETAATVGRDGQPDRAVLMQVTGIFTPKARLDVNLAAQVQVGVVGVPMDGV